MERPGSCGAEPSGADYTCAEAVESEVKASVASGEFVTGLKVRWSRKTGTVIEVELTVSPVNGQGGEHAGVSVIAQDITEIQRRCLVRWLRLRRSCCGYA